MRETLHRMHLGGGGPYLVAQRVDVAAGIIIGQHHTETAVWPHRMLAEDAEVRAPLAQSLGHAGKLGRAVGTYGGENGATGTGAQELYLRDGQPQHGAQMKLKLVQVQRAGERYHARVVGPRGQFGEVDAILVAHEELDAPYPVARERGSDLAGHTAGFPEVFLTHDGRLPALAIVAVLLHMAHRRAEERGAVFLCDGELRDLVVEVDKLLHDDLHDITAGALAGLLPHLGDLVHTPQQALPVAGGRHEGLDDAGQTYLLHGPAHLLGGAGVAVARRLEAELLCGQFANSFAIHGVVDRACARHHLYAALLIVVEALGADGFDLGHDDIGLMPLHDAVESIAGEHVQHLALVGHLHGGRIGIFIAGHYVLAHSLGRNGKLFAELAGAQQQYLFHKDNNK